MLRTARPTNSRSNFPVECLVLAALLFGNAGLTLAQQAPGTTAVDASRTLKNGGAVAQGILVETFCSAIEPGKATVRFKWSSANYGEGGELDITPYYDGFSTGRFETIARFKRSMTSLDWVGGDPGAEYLWRVRLHSGNRLVASEAQRVQVPVCPVDYIDPDRDQPGGDHGQLAEDPVE